MLSLFCQLGKQKIGMVKWLAPGHPTMKEKSGFEFRSRFEALSNFCSEPLPAESKEDTWMVLCSRVSRTEKQMGSDFASSLL